MLILISTNHYIPQSFIKALKITGNSIVAWMKHLHFPVLKLIGLKIFRWAQTLIYPPYQEVICVENFSIIFSRLILLIHINDAVLWHVPLVNIIVTCLLLQIAITWPNINSISLKANFFTNNNGLDSILTKHVFWHRNFICISNSLRNTAVDLSRCL